MRKVVIAVVTSFMVIASSSCSINYAFRRAKQEERNGNWDKAVVHYYQALEKSPNDIDIRLRLETAKRMASKEHLLQSRELWDGEQYEDALVELRTAVELDPLNRQAMFEFKQKLDLLEQMQADAAEKEAWEKLRETEQELLDEEAGKRPVIDINGDEKQSFIFHNRSVADIYQALAKLANINVVFHETVRKNIDKKTDFVLNNATFWDAFDYFVTSNDHFFRTVNDDTLMIVDGSAANRKKYEDQAVKVFYLSNADVKDIFMTLRVIIPGIKLQQDRQQNSIIVRDTPQKLAMIGKLIDLMDKPKAEVIVDVEILEVDSTAYHDVGALLSSYFVTQTFVNSAVEGEGPANFIRMDDFKAINKTNLYLTIPDVAYNFLKTNANARILAKPQLRISEEEKGELHIGERVPVRKTTFNPNQAAGIGIPVDSFEYEEVGIKFTITPRVHHNNEISLEMDIDISAIGAGAGSTNPSFTTRNIKSKIRLSDGETNVLAGLIREEEKLNLEGIAGLSDIPILGRLFSKSQREKRKTDIIITLTPHIVRGALLSIKDLMAIKVGPDVNLGYLGRISMEELENLRYLRGLPLQGGSDRGYRADFYPDEEYYYEEDEERPPRRRD